MPDPLERLAAYGFPLDDLPAEQREVLKELSDEEVAVLLDVRMRLDEAGPDVVAHQMNAVGGLMF